MVGVSLVEHDKLQLGEEGLPLRVLWQHCRVQQVRIAQQHVCALRQLRTVGPRGVAVERGCQKIGARLIGKGIECAELVLSEGFGWKEE